MNNAHTEPFIFHVFFCEAPLKHPQLSETAVNLINCNCNDIKTPVTLFFIYFFPVLLRNNWHTSLSKFETKDSNDFKYYSSWPSCETQVYCFHSANQSCSHQPEGGLRISVHPFTFLRWITTGKKSKWRDDCLLFLRPRQLVWWEVCWPWAW